MAFLSFLHLFLFSLLTSTTLAQVTTLTSTLLPNELPYDQEETQIPTLTSTLLPHELQYDRLDFQLYFHQTPENTTVHIANPNPQYPNFGRVDILDVPLLIGTEWNSTVMAHWQGIAAESDTKTLGWHLSFNIVFGTSEKDLLKGTDTMQVMGRMAPKKTTLLELSIVGGTGKYQMARGTIYGRVLSSPDSSAWIELKIKAFCPLSNIQASY